MSVIKLMLCTNGSGVLLTQIKIALQIATQLKSEIEVLTFRTAKAPSILDQNLLGADYRAMEIAWNQESALVADARKTYDACLIACSADPTKVDWVEIFENMSAAFPSYARACDIIIAGGRSKDLSSSTLNDPISKAALLESGRLALFVAEPSAETADPFARILIAWNDQPAAARAIAQAMPLIEAAAAIRLFIVDESPGQTTRCNQILAYLRRRAPHVEVQEATPLFHTVGHTIIKAAEDWGASMIIMGAYEHSRTREILFGGTTRFVIDHAKCLVMMTN